MNKDYWTCQIRHWLERISALKSTKATFIHLYLLNSHHVFVHSSIYHLIHLSSCPFVYPTHYLFSCTSFNLMFLSVHPTIPSIHLIIDFNTYGIVVLHLSNAPYDREGVLQWVWHCHHRWFIWHTYIYHIHLFPFLAASYLHLDEFELHLLGY